MPDLFPAPRQLEMTGSTFALTLRISLDTPHSTLSTLRIADWPDFPARGAMLDVIRRELGWDRHEFIPHYKQIWLARNRLGGLADSVARLEKVGEEYDAVRNTAVQS